MTKKPNDPLFNLKYMGYCMANMPPEQDGVKPTLSDFVIYAKFYLSFKKNVLMEDEIWDKYTDEQIMVEYFANLFSENKEEREKFETGFTGNDTELMDWFDKQIADNQKEVEAFADKIQDQVKFVPDAMGEG